MIDNRERIEQQLILDACRNDLYSYAMAVHPKFIDNDFAESVAYEIQEVMDGRNDRLILIAPPRHGKLCNSLLPLNYFDNNGNLIQGKHGDLKAGFRVLHHTGKWYDVVETFKPTLCNKVVTFNTGEKIIVHEDHLWQVRDVKETRLAQKRFRQNNRNAIKRGEPPQPVPSSFDIWTVLDTKTLQKEGLSANNNVSGKRGSRYRWQTRQCKEVDFGITDYSLYTDPYWFGYWLGDGKTGASTFVVGKNDYEVCKNEFEKLYKINSENIHKNTGVTAFNFGHQGFFCPKEKHIPQEYLTASVEHRKLLLGGLIDSDGQVDQKTGRVRFVNCNKRLIKDVEYLVRSLGYNCYTTSQAPVLSSSGIQGKKEVFTINFNPTSVFPTIYERKKITKLITTGEHAIVDIQDIPVSEQTEGFCIHVNSPDNTYVVGETFITTHNSMMTSETAPAWFLGKYPDKKIIGASHTQSLADGFGAKCRDLIASPLHEQIFGKAGALNLKKAAAGNFSTNYGGEYFAIGVGGTPIGKGADVYVIDDPIRNRADVESPAQRESLKSWYSSSVLSRLEGQGGIILMHQRWHEDDLAGYLMREYADDGWRIAQFPALIENEFDEEIDYLGRKMGSESALVPQLHSYKKMMRLKSTMQTRDWLSMYQGQPRGSEGDEFIDGMLQRYEQSPMQVRQGLNVYILVDPADSMDKFSDFTCMIVIGVGSDGNYYIIDIVREKLTLAQRATKLIELHRKWRPLSVGYESYGATADIQHIQYVQGEQNYRFPINKINNNVTKLKKVERIRRLIPDLNNGRWFAPDFLEVMGADGKTYHPIEVMIQEEMLPFPNGKHDDGIDAMSRIYDMPIIWPSTYNVMQRSNKDAIISPW